MATRIFLLLTILFVFAASFFARDRLVRSAAIRIESEGEYRRIVSMAPNITETLYALGLGDRVAGVTRFCKYPPEVEKKPKIGGHFDPNFEAVLALRPGLVILLDEHVRSLPGFRKLGLKTHVVHHQTIGDILESLRSIARVCGVESRGRELAEDLERRLERIRRRTQDAPRPRVLVAVDRTPGLGRLADVYVAGPGSLSEKLIELAGGVNAYRGGGAAYPVVSTEGILHCNPEVIIDLMASRNQKERNLADNLADWRREVPYVTAVENDRVYAMDKDYATVPGPRLIRTVEDLARILHPEIDWKAP
ncbi:MAG: ABC transporter substrate-binding protein [Pirellulales bacterium]|nr:ABC transporter substrate-binding protein [Pirellulales bacterium]